MSLDDETKDKIERLIIPRHTYSEANASRFLPIIDKCLSNKTNEFISCDDAKLAITSLKQRLNEAFLWLTHNDTILPKDAKHTKKDYTELRRNVRLTPVSFGGKPGIYLNYRKFKNVVKQQLKKITSKDLSSTSVSSFSSSDSSESNNKEIKLNWKDRVLSYLTDDTQKMLIMDTPEDFNHRPLDDLDIEWITKTFTSAGLEFEVDVMMIKSVK